MSTKKAPCERCGRNKSQHLQGGMDGAAYLDEPTSTGALLSRLDSLLVANEFVDCVLELGEGELIPIHGVVAAARSGYVMGALLRGIDFAPYQGKVVRRIRLPVGDVLGTIPAAGVRKLVHVWYTDNIELDGLQDAADLWAAADFFVTWKGVADKCCEHARAMLAVDNWAKVWKLGDLFKRPELCQAAVAYAASSFNDVVAHFVWKDTPLEAVLKLLGHELLYINSEDEVLLTALSWAEAAEGRAEALAKLLSVVRLPHVSGATRDKLRIHPLVSGSIECMQLLAEAAAWVPSNAEDESSERLWGPRRATNRSLVLAGWGRGQRYDVETNTWYNLSSPVMVKRYAAATSLGGLVYFAGGYAAGYKSGRVTCFDPAAANGAGTWALVAPMHIARTHAAAASLNGFLYVSGGGVDGADADPLCTVERYEPALNTWEAVADMKYWRFDHQLVALGGFLYAIGGCVFTTHLANAERYNPATNTWTPISSMAVGRSECAAAAMGGYLYVTGGRGGDGIVGSCERYDPASNSWSPIADLPEPRRFHALACLRGSLYVVGGEAVFGVASTAPPWRYDVPTNTWVVAPLGADSAEMITFQNGCVWTAV
jgi:kelch-like protein 20